MSQRSQSLCLEPPDLNFFKALPTHLELDFGTCKTEQTQRRRKVGFTVKPSSTLTTKYQSHTTHSTQNTASHPGSSAGLTSSRLCGNQSLGD